MKRSTEIQGASMFHVAKHLNIGRTNLFKGLRDLGILDADNTPKPEYEGVGLFAFQTVVSNYKLIKIVNTLKANGEGIKFIRDLCLKHPELFPSKKNSSFKR